MQSPFFVGRYTYGRDKPGERNIEPVQWGLLNFHKWFGCAAKDESIHGVSAGVEGREKERDRETERQMSLADSLARLITWLSWNANQR